MTADDVYAELDGEGRAIFGDYLAAAEAVDRWTERKEELAARLIDRLGEATKATVDGKHVATRIAGGVVDRFDSVRFREAEPAIYNAFIVPSHRRAYLRLAPHLRLPR